MKAKKATSTADAIKIVHRRLFRGRPERIQELDETRREMALGEKIRLLREESGFTQHQLARRIGTQTSAISRIEDADYDRHSVQTLLKVAEALGMRLIIDLEPLSAGPKRRKLA